MLSSSKKGAPVIKAFGASDILTATIAKDEALSGSINIGGARYLAIVMPSNWTAADLTFQAAAHSGDTFKDVYEDDGTEVSITAAADRVIVINNKKDALLPFAYIKIRSGTTGVPVTQGDDRSFTILCEG